MNKTLVRITLLALMFARQVSFAGDLPDAKLTPGAPNEKSGLKFAHYQHVGLVQGPHGIWDVREL
jgi:hypothetical protein